MDYGPAALALQVEAWDRLSVRIGLDPQVSIFSLGPFCQSSKLTLKLRLWERVMIREKTVCN